MVLVHKGSSYHNLSGDFPLTNEHLIVSGHGPPDIGGMISLKVDNLTYRTTTDDVRDRVSFLFGGGSDSVNSFTLALVLASSNLGVLSKQGLELELVPVIYTKYSLIELKTQFCLPLGFGSLM